MQYFFLAIIWGYYVLHTTGWLPWHIGGHKTIGETIDVALSKTDPRMPYIKYARQILVYALGTMGFHVGDAIV